MINYYKNLINNKLVIIKILNKRSRIFKVVLMRQKKISSKIKN